MLVLQQLISYGALAAATVISAAVLLAQYIHGDLAGDATPMPAGCRTRRPRRAARAAAAPDRAASGARRRHARLPHVPAH